MPKLIVALVFKASMRSSGSRHKTTFPMTSFDPWSMCVIALKCCEMELNSCLVIDVAMQLQLYLVFYLYMPIFQPTSPGRTVHYDLDCETAEHTMQSTSIKCIHI